MSGSPQYLGTQTGEVVKAIAVDSMHTWRKIQEKTGFSEKDLNYHLSILYNDKVLVRQGRDYYIIPELEEEYLVYYRTSSSPGPEIIRTPEPIVKKELSFLNLKGLALILLLVLSLTANLY